MTAETKCDGKDFSWQLIMIFVMGWTAVVAEGTTVAEVVTTAATVWFREFFEFFFFSSCGFNGMDVSGQERCAIRTELLWYQLTEQGAETKLLE